MQLTKRKKTKGNKNENSHNHNVQKENSMNTKDYQITIGAKDESRESITVTVSLPESAADKLQAWGDERTNTLLNRVSFRDIYNKLNAAHKRGATKEQLQELATKWEPGTVQRTGAGGTDPFQAMLNKINSGQLSDEELSKLIEAQKQRQAQAKQEQKKA